VLLVSYLAQFTGLRTDVGHAAVVRNGHHPARPFQTGIGPVSVRIPKVRSKDGTPVTFRSALLRIALGTLILFMIIGFLVLRAS
jgi:putative transposase